VGRVVAHDKAKKVLVFKKKKRKQYRRTRGHRQPFTAVVVEEIHAG
jgi:large subunit ribosomal protein L21